MRFCARLILGIAAAITLSTVAAFAQGTGNDRCVSLINNDARKVLDTRAKANRKCVHNATGGSATACVDGTDAKTESKKAKLGSRYSSTCASNLPTFGLAAGSTAIGAAAEGAANDVAHDLFGASVNVGTGDTAKCQEKVIQRAGQVIVTRWREFRSCKKGGLSGFANSAALAAGCLGGPNGPQPDPDHKLSSGKSKLADAVQSKCITKGISPVGTAFPGMCTNESDSNFADCVAERVACRFCEAVKAADNISDSSLNCDLFDNDAIDGTCGPLPTPTITPSPTPTPTNPPTPTIPPICQSQIPITPIAEAPFTIGGGSPFCGGTALNPPAQSPFSGTLDTGTPPPFDLGAGCLYAGGFQGIRLPNGSTSVLAVTGVTLLPNISVTLGGSAGSGPTDCTKGAGPGRHCSNGDAGVGGGACFSDVDCSGQVGSCNLDANCYFGPPIPVAAGAIGTCIINAFLTDMCGQVTLTPLPAANLATALSSRVYVTGGPVDPCPICQPDNTCSFGKNAGGSCTPVGDQNTSPDCPPDDASFVAALTVPIASLTTGTSTLTEPGGMLCPGQLGPGAFGVADATTVTEVGVPPGGGPNALGMTLGATFCIPKSGNALIDFIARLPGAGAVSAPGQLDLSQVLP